MKSAASIRCRRLFRGVTADNRSRWRRVLSIENADKRGRQASPDLRLGETYLQGRDSVGSRGGNRPRPSKQQRSWVRSRSDRRMTIRARSMKLSGLGEALLMLPRFGSFWLRVWVWHNASDDHSRVTAMGAIVMPTALRSGPYRFYFYSYDCAEPRHMHVDREKFSAKIWLDPDVRIAENRGYGRQELREVERIARQDIELLRGEWDEFCGNDADAN